MQEMKLIITDTDGAVNLRTEGVPPDVHVRLANGTATQAERLVLVAMDATINALEGFGLGGEGDQ